MARMKSRVACQFNLETMLDRPCYFWTFTFEVPADYETNVGIWDQFLRALRRRFPTMYGIRVYEFHANGCLHVHALIDQRLSVNELRSIGKCYGVGRMQVKYVPLKKGEGLTPYLVKYLGKGMREYSGELKRGKRLWATFGPFPNRSKVKNIVCDSKEANFARWWMRASHLKVTRLFLAVAPYLSDSANRLRGPRSVPELKMPRDRWFWLKPMSQAFFFYRGEHGEAGLPEPPYIAP